MQAPGLLFALGGGEGFSSFFDSPPPFVRPWPWPDVFAVALPGQMR
jgi:hypothetical protein